MRSFETRGPVYPEDNYIFDYRKDPEPRVETETLDGSTIRSYVIPVIQERPSD